MVLSVLAMGLGLGLMVGFQYGRGATFERGLIKTLWIDLLAVLAFLGLCCFMKWNSVGFCTSVGLGIVLAVFARVQWMLWRMPASLRAASLAARPGESEPSIGRFDGMWVLSYPDGTVMEYDNKGNVSRIDFVATEWKFGSGESKKPSPEIDEGDRRLM